SARLFGGEGVLENLLGVPLHAEAPETAYRLGRHADVAHDRDVGRSDGGDTRRTADTALDLDGMRGPFLDQAASVFQRLLRADLIAHERHVGHEQAAAYAAGHATGVVNHVGQ